MQLRGDKLSADQVQEKRWLIHAVMSLGLVLVVMSVSSINVALPTLVRDLGSTATDLQWIVDSYALVFAGILLFAGALGDRFGRRGAFVFGLGIFALASLLSAFAESSSELIAYRAIMGVGAAFVMPATLSIITNVFTDSKERTKAVALWAGFAGAGASIGPVASGLLLGSFWWGSIFLINVPVILLALAGAFFIVPTSRDPQRQRLDFVGALLSIAGLALLLFGIIEGPNNGWLSSETIVSVGAGLGILVGFIWWESKSDHPMLPVHYFRSRRFSISSLSITLTFLALFGLFFVLIQYMQFVLGYTALEAALRTLPLTFMFIASSAIAPRLLDRWGTKLVMTTGLVIAAIAFLMFASLKVDSGYLIIFLGMVTLGAGMGIAMPPATDALIGAVPPRKAGVGSAMNDATREVGGAVGIAIFGSVLASTYRRGIEDQAAELPTDLAELASESIGAAQAIATDFGDAGLALIGAANQAFTDGLVQTMFSGAGLLLISALIVYRWMPNKEAPIAD